LGTGEHTMPTPVMLNASVKVHLASHTGITAPQVHITTFVGQLPVYLKHSSDHLALMPTLLL
jgi:hypothetical protein